MLENRHQRAPQPPSAGYGPSSSVVSPTAEKVHHRPLRISVYVNVNTTDATAVCVNVNVNVKVSNIHATTGLES
jgi:hypothetical protein